MTAADPAVLDWMISWFEKRGSVPGALPAEKASVDYFSAGLVDSLTVVELIADAEAHFGVRFSESHFQERRFATIGGVAEIVAELRASAKGA